MGDNPPKIGPVRTFRQSTNLLESSIFESSNGKKLVEYICQKRGINHAQRIFDNCAAAERVDRSFPIEIVSSPKKTKEDIPVQPVVKDDNNLQKHMQSRNPKRTTNVRDSIGRRVLLNEFEKTSKESFKPLLSSTPNSVPLYGLSDISGISRITAACREEEVIPETQRSKVTEENYLNESFKLLTEHNSHREIPDAGIQHCANVSANINQQEETLKNNSQEYSEHGVYEANGNATLCNTNGDSKRGTYTKLPEGQKVQVLKVVSTAHNLLHSSQNKDNSSKTKSSFQTSKRVRSHPVASHNHRALSLPSSQGKSPSEKSKRGQSHSDASPIRPAVSPLISSHASSPLQRTKDKNDPVASPNRPIFTPSISKKGEVRHVHQTVLQEPSNSNSDPEIEDDCESLKENKIPEKFRMGLAHVRIKRIPNSLTTSRKISVNEKVKKIVQQAHSGASSDSDTSSEDDCENPKETKNHENRKTNHSYSRIKSNLTENRDRSLNRLSSVSSNNGGRQVIQQQIASSDFENNCENFKENDAKKSSAQICSRIEQNSRISKVKSPNRLTHSLRKPSKKDVASGGPPTSDSDSDEINRNIKENKNRKKSAGNTSSSKSRIESEIRCLRASLNSPKKNENRNKINDLLKEQLRQKPVVYIPIVQNFNKDTVAKDIENIASKDCGTQTSKDLQIKNDVYYNEIIEIMTSDEEEGQVEQVVRAQVLPRGLQNVENNRNGMHLSQNYDSYPIDLRTRRSNQEKKRSLRLLRVISSEKQSPNIPPAHQVRRSKLLVHPPQLRHEVVMPAERDVCQRGTPANRSIYTEEELLQILTNDVQPEEARDSCGVETGALHCSLESASSSNAMDYDNGENIDEHMRTLNLINKVQQGHIQQNTTVKRKSKKIVSQMDSLKRDYLNIGKNLKKISVDTNNMSRRKLYSQDAYEDENSASINSSVVSSQETPVVPHSKEETRKALNFSANSQVAKKERLESVLSDWEIEKEVTFTPPAEVVNNNENVFKIPMKPPLKKSNKKAVERKSRRNITKERNENVVSNPVIPAEERHQSPKSQSKTGKSNRLKASKNNESNSADISVEPEDMVDDHNIEKVSISKSNIEKNNNNRVGKDADERRTARLSTIADNTKARENSMVTSSDAKQPKPKKRARKKQNNRINDQVETIQEAPSTTDHGLRRSARERRAPIAYWSCRNHDQGSDIYHLDLQEILTMKKKQKKKKVKVLEVSPITARSPVKKRGRRDRRKVIKDNIHVEDAENNIIENKESEEPLIINTHQPTAGKSTMNDESHVAYDLFDKLKESFTTEKSKKRKDSTPTEENVMNKIIKLSENPSTKVSKSSVNDRQVVNPMERITSSDDGISTSEENHQTKPPWYTRSHRTPTDSGIQSYSTHTHVCKQDRLLLWLKNLSTPRSLTSNKEIVQILHSSTIKIANVEDLVFQEINGVEYAYYLGEDNNYGYMKFHPQSMKPYAKTKAFELKFLSLVGNVIMQIDKTTCTAKNGDLITVPKGIRYSISNATDDPAILFFIRR